MPVFFINAEHFAQSIHGQPFGKIGHHIDLAVIFLGNRFHIIEQAINLTLNTGLQMSNIIGRKNGRCAMRSGI